MIQLVVKPYVQPGLTTGWTNSCSFNTVVKPVCQTWFDNRLFTVVVSCKRGLSF